MRNLHENNQPEVTPEEAKELGDRVYVVLPTLTEGNQYELVKLTSGKTAVVFNKAGETPVTEHVCDAPHPYCTRDGHESSPVAKTQRELFEQRYHS